MATSFSRRCLLYLISFSLMAFQLTAQYRPSTDNCLPVEAQKNPLVLKLIVFLEGPFLVDKMTTDLGKAKLLPQNQPYNMPPWNYPGTESVSNIPNGIVDWVLVEIREPLCKETKSPKAVLSRKAGFLMSDGQVMNTDDLSPISFDSVFG